VAFWDERQAWIEMRLRAGRDCLVHVRDADLRLAFRRGDEISTEISCKYTQAAFRRRLRRTGLVLERWYTDDERLFALALLRRVRMPLTLL
jgi:L-histidine N-alpha-methyltransferase